MKIVGISGSPRKNGNTEILVKEALKGVEEEGLKTEFISLAGKNINYCLGCPKSECKEGVCKIKDDMQEFYELLPKVDGIILGSPVYYTGPTGLIKNFIDRLRCLIRPTKKLKGKVGGVIVVGGRSGHSITEFILLDSMCGSHEMILPGGVCMECFAKKLGEVGKNKKTLEDARELGKKLAKFCKELEKK